MALQTPELNVVHNKSDISRPKVESHASPIDSLKKIYQRVIDISRRRDKSASNVELQTFSHRFADAVGPMAGVAEILLIPLGSIGTRPVVIMDNNISQEEQKEIAQKVQLFREENGNPPELTSIIPLTADQFTRNLKSVYNVDDRNSLAVLWPRPESSLEARSSEVKNQG